MSQKVVTLDMLKTFSEIKEYTGSITGTNDNLSKDVPIIEVPLEKGYIYEVYTVTTQNLSDNGTINSNIWGNNCTVYDVGVRGTGVNGGGVPHTALIKVENDGASVKCGTYIFFVSITYKCYARVRKIAII